MPTRKTTTKQGTLNALKHAAYESCVINWLMQDGWEVYTPMLDNGHQTDLLISDGPNYYRIQVKTIEAVGEHHQIENRWKGSHVDFVVIFARNSSWGYVMSAFEVNTKRLNAKGHQRFSQTKNDFIKAFHKLA